MRYVRLGVNIDHVATLRNARGGTHPDPVWAARLAIDAGAYGITIHLREDRRHIRDDDLVRLSTSIAAPINLEMAVTEEMLGIARTCRPHAVCLVPERREEVTTEGGLDVASRVDEMRGFIATLLDCGIRVSLFVDPDEQQIQAAARLGSPVVELHTGAYAQSRGEGQARELERLCAAARQAGAAGIECHAGHGLNYENVEAVAAIPEVVELNIGHFLVGESLASGLGQAVQRMRVLIAKGAAAG